MAKMLKTKFGLVSLTEARCLGDLDRWLKRKRKRERDRNGKLVSSGKPAKPSH